jgi:phosphate-selective porin OprO/OprP
MRPSHNPAACLIALTLAAGLAGGSAARAEDAELLQQLRTRLEALEQRLHVVPPTPLPGAADSPRPVSDQIRTLLERIEALERRQDPLLLPLPAHRQADAGGEREPGKDRASRLAKEQGEEAQPREQSKAERSKGQEPEWMEVGKDLELTSNVWANGIQLRTADEAFRLHAGGRLDFDNSWYKPDPSLPFVLDDGTAFRRARLRADGSLWELIDFAAEVSFANIQDINAAAATVQVGSVGIKDFWLQFKQVPVVGNVRVGHVTGPVGLERMTSDNVYYYMEKTPGHDAFLGPLEFSNGVVLFDSYFDDRVTAAASFTKVGRTTVDPFGFDAADGQYGVFGRLTALPVYADEGRLLVHIGVGGFHFDPDNNTVATGPRPLVRAGGGGQIPSLLRTGSAFTPDGPSVVNVEGALVLGRFSLSGEYTAVFVPRVFGAFDGLRFSGSRGDATYHAGYVELGYFLTRGDYRRYDKQNGTWGRTVPQENAFLVPGGSGQVCWGRGAVQLLGRYSYLDLASGDPVLTPADGAGAGLENDFTVGLVWYLNSQTNIQINYIYTRLDYVNGTEGDLHGLGCRVHLDF